MTVAVTPYDFVRYASRMPSVHARAFDHAQRDLDPYGITQSSLRLAHFISQVMAETEALRICIEDLSHGAERIVQLWPSHFQRGTGRDPAQYAGMPEALANVVHAGRMGNSAPDDGYTYRGRGLLQLTGKDEYRNATLALRKLDPGAPDLVIDPDQAFASDWCLRVAAAIWKHNGANEAADTDSVERVTRAINRGENRLEDRRRWFDKVAAHIMSS